MKFIQYIIRLRPIAYFLRNRHASDAVCMHCQLPFANVKPHFVAHSKDRNFFAVCEYCYKRMTDQELEEAYRRLWYVVWRDFEKPCGWITFRNSYIKDIKQRYVDNTYPGTAQEETNAQ